MMVTEIEAEFISAIEIDCDLANDLFTCNASVANCEEMAERESKDRKVPDTRRKTEYGLSLLRRAC